MLNLNDYRQVSGTVTGLSVPLKCASLALETIDSKALVAFKRPPKAFLRHVDGCFCVICGSDLQPFLDHLHCIQSSIEFVVEEESDDERISFLDLLVQRSSAGFTTTVYI